MGTNGRPWYFWPLIAFVGGLLIGWLVIGWGLWPVTWTNASVPDLRPELRMDYVRMVAESYDRTGNLDLARQRLAGWSQADLTKLLLDTQGVLVARDQKAAESVQRLSVALGAAPGPTNSGGVPATAPTAVPPSGSEPQPSRLRQVCTAGIFLLLAAAALVGLVLLFRKWRSAHAPDEQEMAPLEGGGLSTQSQAALSAEREKQRPLTSAVDRGEGGAAPGGAPFAGRTERTREGDWSIEDDRAERPPAAARPIPPRPVGPAPATPARSEPVEQQHTPPTPGPTAAPVTSTAGLPVLVENIAMYQMGEPDYDEAFDINDPVDGYMGQCGLQLIEPFGRERDQAVALQVWLWDSSDPDTQTLVLMSEGAYRDTALRSQYAGEHHAISVRPGTEFELTSHDLLLRGRVEKVGYAEAEPVRGVFADLHVKLTVYRRS